MRSIYLNIGSNKGDRHANIEQAVALVMRDPVLGKGRLRRSPFIESEPQGFDSDSKFVNLGVAIDFFENTLPCDPLEVLDIIQGIEKEIAPDSPHRNPDGSYRDRVVDIDIIEIEGIKMVSERLVLPHPRSSARDFVMRPMAFLAPGWYPATADVGAGSHIKKNVAEMGRDTIESFKNKKKTPLVVVLDNIRSFNNVGSVFRTADAFCVEGIALCGITACPPAPEIHKTALGAENSVDWKYYEDTLLAVNDLKKQGYTIVCLEQVHNSVSMESFEPDRSLKYALIVGNEVSGVGQSVVDASDICLEIPQAGTKHSLNVSVSAALAMWTFFRATL